MKILITGGSGYVGGMLAERFAERGDVDKILLIDKEPLHESLNMAKNKDKIEFIQANLADMNWQDDAAVFGPDTVIHTAWQIREMYGRKRLQHIWNIEGSDNVYDFAFGLPSVKKLMHFSTVASYGAYPDNSVDHFFTEDESFRKSDYLYAEEKRIAEEHLKEKYQNAKAEGKNVPQVFVIRPASITGPRARAVKKGIGLQSVLSGKVMSFVPITPKWLRQFIHEDDVVGITELLATQPSDSKYEIFNACPPDSVVLGKEMAKAVGKKALMLQPWMVRIAFFLAWHLSLGKIPTSRGGWKSYSYPIAVDGSKIVRVFGYQYKKIGQVINLPIS